MSVAHQLALREALDSLSSKKKNARDEDSTGSYGTKYGTNSISEREPVSQVIEKNGGDDETRTRDLCRDSATG